MNPALMKDMTLAEVMRASDVSRWHIVNTIKRQSLAEHQYFVAIIAWRIYHDLHGNEAVVDSAEVMRLLFRAMFHDIEEIFTGDVPSPVKGDEPPPTGVDEAIIRIADMIEAYWWIYNNGAGVRKAEIVDHCFVKLKKRTDAGSPVLSGEIHAIVDAILLELGLPVRACRD